MWPPTRWARRRGSRSLLQEIEAHLADGNRGEIVRDGFRVVLAGPPNVGKSSLLNALARREVAIVSAEAGTTRDVLEVRLDLGGYPVILTDTAGIREAAGAVEREGIRRTLRQVGAADLVVWLIDAAAPDWSQPEEVAAQGSRTMVVLNKVDLRGADPGLLGLMSQPAVRISAVTGEGLGVLTERLAAEVAARLTGGGGLLLTQERHRRAIEAGREALQLFLGSAPERAELGAEDLRVAANALGRVVGRVGVEDVLGQIFGRFCIGK